MRIAGGSSFGIFMFFCYTKCMRILIVQSRTSPDWLDREQGNYRRSIGKSADIEFLSSLDERLAWTSPDEFLKNCDGAIFGGSSDFDFHGGRDAKDPARLMSLIILTRAKSIVKHAMAENVPILGVCFGHQLIAQMFGGEIRCDDAQGKFGSHEIHLTEEGKKDELFKMLPHTLVAQYWHKDSATNLPEGATLLAAGDCCRFSALRYDSTTYTVQFHPEVERMITDENPKASPEASKLIPLWIERIVAA